MSQATPPFRHLFVPKRVSVLRRGYALADFRADLVAGLTVAIVALPLAMALFVHRMSEVVAVENQATSIEEDEDEDAVRPRQPTCSTAASASRST